jgi:predicted ribosomally synthesized peptide with SipW-like signal peptide
MKAFNKKSILTVIAAALVLSLSMGLTFAYFSDFEAAKGGAQLTLGSQTHIDEEVSDKGKTIVIQNTGTTDVVVRVGVYGPSTMSVTDVSGDKWEYDNGFWYYTEVIKVDGESTPLIAEIKAPKGQIDNFDVVVVQECAQVVYDEEGNIKVPEGWANKIG